VLKSSDRCEDLILMTRQMHMPKLNELQSDVTIAEWLIAVGDIVNEGKAILSVETDKVTVDVEAETNGKVTRLLVRKGDVVKVGQPIMEFE